MGVGWMCEVPSGEEEGPLETAETVTHPSSSTELSVLHLLSSFKMLGPLTQTRVRPEREREKWRAREEGQKGGGLRRVGGREEVSRKHRRLVQRPAPCFFLSWTPGVNYPEVTEKTSDSKASQPYHRTEFST